MSDVKKDAKKKTQAAAVAVGTCVVVAAATWLARHLFGF